jgi:putative SOS response-associated peptidase YedK
MNYYNKQTQDHSSLERRFNASYIDDSINETAGNYQACNSPKTPIVCMSNDAVIDYFLLGLVPFWPSKDNVKKFTLNTKIESIADKPIFNIVVKKRCLISADGVYEWEWPESMGDHEQKYLITLPNNKPFVFGGICSQLTNKETGEIQNTYTIVTTEANEFMSEIHNSKKRMPVILTLENEKAWLNNEPLENFKQTGIELTVLGF